jgi:hypothetical protein
MNYYYMQNSILSFSLLFCSSFLSFSLTTFAKKKKKGLQIVQSFCGKSRVPALL